VRRIEHILHLEDLVKKETLQLVGDAVAIRIGRSPANPSSKCLLGQDRGSIGTPVHLQ